MIIISKHGCDDGVGDDVVGDDGVGDDGDDVGCCVGGDDGHSQSGH